MFDNFVSILQQIKGFLLLLAFLKEGAFKYHLESICWDFCGKLSLNGWNVLDSKKNFSQFIFFLVYKLWLCWLLNNWWLKTKLRNGRKIKDKSTDTASIKSFSKLPRCTFRNDGYEKTWEICSFYTKKEIRLLVFNN